MLISLSTKRGKVHPNSADRFRFLHETDFQVHLPC
jgi:hypothetical protein